MRTSPCRRCGETEACPQSLAGSVAARWACVFCSFSVQTGAAIAQRSLTVDSSRASGTRFHRRRADDREHLVGDVLAREEVFVRPAEWMRLTAGLELRANSHDQVEDSWSLQFWDRSVRRPRLSVRTLSATVTRGPFTLDAGKQFIRWGKTDIVVPTDRFSPRDYLTVIDAPFLGGDGRARHRAVAELHARGGLGAAAHAEPDAALDAAVGRSGGRIGGAVPIVEAPDRVSDGGAGGSSVRPRCRPDRVLGLLLRRIQPPA